MEAKARYNELLAGAHSDIAAALECIRACKHHAERNPQGAAGQYAAAVEAAVPRVNTYRQISSVRCPLTDVREPDQVLDIYERTLLTDPEANRVPRTAATWWITKAELGKAIEAAQQAAVQAKTRARESRRASVDALREAAARAPRTVTRSPNTG